MKEKVLIIAGPTCIGKSSISIKLAQEFNGEIISADSMQIYQYCDIGTAKIMPEEMVKIQHHGLSIISPLSEFSVGEYKEFAEQKILEIRGRNKLPILVGGTGLYLEALMKNYNFAQTDKNLQIREKYEKILSEKGKEALFAILMQKNPQKAQTIEINNTRRIIRALEIEESNSKTSIICNEPKFDFLFCVLIKNREELYDKINGRVENMLELGLENEVNNLLKKGVSFSNQCMQSIGYKEWKEYFNGEITKEELTEKIKQNTRRYAKRQITWFKHRENAIYFDLDERDFEIKLKNRIKEWLNK